MKMNWIKAGLFVALIALCHAGSAHAQCVPDGVGARIGSGPCFPRFGFRSMISRWRSDRRFTRTTRRGTA